MLVISRIQLAAGLATALGLLLPVDAPADYVRDGITINMRAGPDVRENRVRYLRSGDVVTKLEEQDLWVRIRTAHGERNIGWVEKRFLTKQEPPSLALPRVQTRLEQAQARVEELESRLGEQTAAIEEVETLRARNEELETSNLQLAGSARWKSMGIGALIALGGLLVGMMWPRGGTRGGRKIKL
jgi:SH3-like domain-containing protein